MTRQRRSRRGDPVPDWVEPYAELLAYLRDRWEDERGFEEWDDYVAEVRAAAARAGHGFVGLLQRPFRVELRVDGVLRWVIARERSISWGNIP